MLELPKCSSETFQVFLDEFSKQNPSELKVIVLDNGAFHKAKVLVIPKNIMLIFLPPYSPELNPAEKMWQTIKRNFTNKFFSTLDELSLFITESTTKITHNIVKSTCAFGYVFAGSYWAMK
jgi:transposase